MELSLARVEQHLRTLVQTIGPRVTGRLEDQRAIAYIVGGSRRARLGALEVTMTRSTGAGRR